MAEKQFLRFPVVAAGAEHLVMGYLMRRNILSYKAPPNNEGYDLICIHPDPRRKLKKGKLPQARVQVKSRYATDCDMGFLVKKESLDAFDFLVEGTSAARARAEQAASQHVATRAATRGACNSWRPQRLRISSVGAIVGGKNELRPYLRPSLAGASWGDAFAAEHEKLRTHRPDRNMSMTYGSTPRVDMPRTVFASSSTHFRSCLSSFSIFFRTAWAPASVLMASSKCLWHSAG